MSASPYQEALISTYHVDAEAEWAVPQSVPPVLSPFNDDVLEAAERQRDSGQALEFKPLKLMSLYGKEETKNG